MIRNFFEGLIQAKSSEANLWVVSCNGVELGVIENHKGDSEWIAEHRWEIWGSTPRLGFGGRLLHRYSHGFSTLESAVKNLCMWKSGTIIALV